jgi:nitronate monooxygenase
MNDDRLMKKLGIELPIIQAPMGGGPSTPELVAAVSNAGGLGSLAAAYLKPVEILDAVQRIRSLTSKPFNVNLFSGGYQADSDFDAQPMIDVLAGIHAELGLPAPLRPTAGPDPFPEQFEAVMEARPPIFSFTFGVPSGEFMQRLRRYGIATLGTATTVDEGRALITAGVDAIVAQGAEAGAHRGTFAGSFEAAMVPTCQLVRGIAGLASVPVIASGGIMNGREVAETMTLGASAAQLGTAFLCCPESGASTAYKQAILAAKEDTTVITRAFSGRPARGLRNAFIAMLKKKEDVILPYPQQNVLTRAMRTAAAKRGDARFLSLWAGIGVARARNIPAGELVGRLTQEMKEFDLANQRC